MRHLLPLLATLSVFGMPTALIALHLVQRHREKMKAIEATTASSRLQLAELEATRADLESRVRTLETIVTEGDRDLDARLRDLSAAADRPQLPARR